MGCIIFLYGGDALVEVEIWVSAGVPREVDFIRVYKASPTSHTLIPCSTTCIFSICRRLCRIRVEVGVSAEVHSSSLLFQVVRGDFVEGAVGSGILDYMHQLVLIRYRMRLFANGVLVTLDESVGILLFQVVVHARNQILLVVNVTLIDNKGLAWFAHIRQVCTTLDHARRFVSMIRANSATDAHFSAYTVVTLRTAQFVLERHVVLATQLIEGFKLGFELAIDFLHGGDSLTPRSAIELCPLAVIFTFNRIYISSLFLPFLPHDLERATWRKMDVLQIFACTLFLLFSNTFLCL